MREASTPARRAAVCSGDRGEEGRVGSRARAAGWEGSGSVTHDLGPGLDGEVACHVGVGVCGDDAVVLGDRRVECGGKGALPDLGLVGDAVEYAHGGLLRARLGHGEELLKVGAVAALLVADQELEGHGEVRGGLLERGEVLGDCGGGAVGEAAVSAGSLLRAPMLFEARMQTRLGVMKMRELLNWMPTRWTWAAGAAGLSGAAAARRGRVGALTIRAVDRA